MYEVHGQDDHEYRNGPGYTGGSTIGRMLRHPYIGWDECNRNICGIRRMNTFIDLWYNQIQVRKTAEKERFIVAF